MSSNHSHPKWWQLYLIFPLLIALFAVDTRLQLPTIGHQAVQIGIILIVYGIIHSWLKANGTALSNMDQRQYHGTVIVTRIPLHPLPEPKTDNRPMFQFPTSEVKGTLSDTFEMETIDAEFLPVVEVTQELKKE